MFSSAICTSIHQPGPRVLQRGGSLLELMVGIAIGLMVVAAAVGTLVISKNSSGTVADASVLTNQANNVLRSLTFYVRQAGVLEFIRTGTGSNTYLLDDPPSSPVPPPSATEIISGTDNDRHNSSDTLVLWGASRSATVSKDCQGKTIPNDGALMRNKFYIGGGDNNELICVGALNNTGQPIASNVEDFQVLYFEENTNGTAYTWRTADNVDNWKAVTAVDICLQIRGEVKQPLSMFPTTTYKNCKNEDTPQDGYLRAVVRQVVQLRNRSTSL